MDGAHVSELFLIDRVSQISEKRQVEGHIFFVLKQLQLKSSF